MITRKFTTKVSKNLGRVLSDKIFRYENVVVEVCDNSNTHAYVTFTEISNNEDPKYVCRINVYENLYTLAGPMGTGTMRIDPKNTIVDRWRIYRWLDKTIKNYRGCK